MPRCVAQLLQDTKRIKEARDKALANRNNYGGVSADDMRRMQQTEPVAPVAPVFVAAALPRSSFDNDAFTSTEAAPPAPKFRVQFNRRVMDVRAGGFHGRALTAFLACSTPKSVAALPPKLTVAPPGPPGASFRPALPAKPASLASAAGVGGTPPVDLFALLDVTPASPPAPPAAAFASASSRPQPPVAPHVSLLDDIFSGRAHCCTPACSWLRD